MNPNLKWSILSIPCNDSSSELVMDSDQDEWCWDDLSQDAVFLICRFVPEFDRLWFRDVSMTAWNTFIRKTDVIIPLQPHHHVRLDGISRPLMEWSIEHRAFVVSAAARSGLDAIVNALWKFKDSNAPDLSTSAVYNAALGNHRELVTRIIDISTRSNMRIRYLCERSIAGFVDGGHFDSLLAFEWDVSARLGMRNTCGFLCKTYMKLYRSRVERGCKQRDVMKWLVFRAAECAAATLEVHASDDGSNSE